LRGWISWGAASGGAAGAVATIESVIKRGRLVRAAVFGEAMDMQRPSKGAGMGGSPRLIVSRRRPGRQRKPAGGRANGKNENGRDFPRPRGLYFGNRPNFIRVQRPGFWRAVRLSRAEAGRLGGGGSVGRSREVSRG